MSNEKQEPKDGFSIYQKSTDDIFQNVKKSVPQYYQSITNVQQECLQAFENIVNATIALQKEYVTKTGIASNMSTSTIKVVRDATEEMTKFASLQNQVVLATIDATQQNIKTFNDNAKSFADLNKSIFQSLLETFTIKKN